MREHRIGLGGGRLQINGEGAKPSAEGISEGICARAAGRDPFAWRGGA